MVLSETYLVGVKRDSQTCLWVQKIKGHCHDHHHERVSNREKSVVPVVRVLSFYFFLDGGHKDGVALFEKAQGPGPELLDL